MTEKTGAEHVRGWIEVIFVKGRPATNRIKDLNNVVTDLEALAARIEKLEQGNPFPRPDAGPGGNVGAGSDYHASPAPPDLDAMARYRAAIIWALGDEDSDFRPRQDGEGSYYWRTELRQRAGALDVPRRAENVLEERLLGEVMDAEVEAVKEIVYGDPISARPSDLVRRALTEFLKSRRTR